MPIKQIPFEVKNPDNLTIRGFEIYLDSEIPCENAIILSHGFKANMEKTRPYAQYLAQKGYRCFIFDFCGTWNSSSDGSFEDYMTPMTEVGDLNAVRKMVEARSDVKTISLLGQSQGGFVSSYSAGTNPKQVDSLILLFPAMCIPDDARKGQMQNYHFDPNNIPDHIGTPPFILSGQYARSVLHVDIFKVITGYHGPVLLVHGTADPVVNISYANKTDETYRENGNQIEYFQIPGAGHGFEGDDLAKAEEYIVEFLKNIRITPKAEV